MKRGLPPLFSLSRLFKKYFSLQYVWAYALLGIVLVAIFFRFYNMPGRYVFDFDPTRDALISIVGEEQLLFPPTGPKSGIANFTFGPWYYYEIILFSVLTPFQYAPWILIGSMSVITVIVYFFIGKYLFSKYFGLLLAFIVAIAPSELGPVTGLSNPNFVPLHAALTVLFFILYLKKHISLFWIFIWGLVIGIGINHHYQAVGLLILPLIAILYRRDRILLSLLGLGFGIVVSFLPLILFNSFENWHTVRGFSEYLQTGRSTQPNRWLTFVLDFLPNFWSYVLGVPYVVGIGIGVYVFFVNVFAFIKKALPKTYVLLFLALVLNILFIRYATSSRENYYFLYLHPFIFILWAFTLWYSLGNRYLRFVALIVAYIVLFLNLKEDIRRLPEEIESRQIRNQVSILERTYENSDLSIYRCGDRVGNVAQAMAFLLYHDNRLSNNGVAIGLKSDQCLDTSLFVELPFDYHQKYYIVDFEKFPKAEKFWTLVTPETVYKDTFTF